MWIQEVDIDDFTDEGNPLRINVKFNIFEDETNDCIGGPRLFWAYEILKISATEEIKGELHSYTDAEETHYSEIHSICQKELQSLTRETV